MSYKQNYEEPNQMGCDRDGPFSGGDDRPGALGGVKERPKFLIVKRIRQEDEKVVRKFEGRGHDISNGPNTIKEMEESWIPFF